MASSLLESTLDTEALGLFMKVYLLIFPLSLSLTLCGYCLVFFFFIYLFTFLVFFKAIIVNQEQEMKVAVKVLKQAALPSEKREANLLWREMRVAR